MNKMKDYKMILLLGSDVFDSKYIEGCEKKNKKNKYYNADSINLLIINKKTSKIKLVSFMRDIWIEELECKYKKLNATLKFGGPELSVSIVNKYFDLQIKNYILINMKSFIEVVDILGGLDINLTDREIEYINEWIKSTKEVTKTDKETKILVRSGMNHLNGTQVLTHARNRTLGYEWKRMDRQRNVISLIAKKLKKTRNLFKICQLGIKIFPYIKNNLSIIDIVNCAIIFSKINMEGIDTYCVPQEGTYKIVNDGIWRFELDFEKSKKLLHDFILKEDDIVQKAKEESLNNIKKPFHVPTASRSIIEEWIKKIKDVCIEEGLHTGIYPSNAIAISVAESNAGTTKLANKCYNFVGMTMPENWVGKTVTFWDGLIYKRENFVSNRSWANYSQAGSYDAGIKMCIRHFGWNFWATSLYKEAGVLNHISSKISLNDVKEDAKLQLKQIVSIYAPLSSPTNIGYEKSLLDIIDEYDLHKYDEEFLSLGGWNGLPPAGY